MKPASDKFPLFLALVDPFLQFSPRPPDEEKTSKAKANLQTRKEIVDHVVGLQRRPTWVVDLVSSWLAQLPPDMTKRETLLRWYFRVGTEVRKLTRYSDVGIVASLGVFACYQLCLTEHEDPMDREWGAQMFELGEFLKWAQRLENLVRAQPIEKRLAETLARKKVAEKAARKKAANLRAYEPEAEAITTQLLALEPRPNSQPTKYGRYQDLETLFEDVHETLFDRAVKNAKSTNDNKLTNPERENLRRKIPKGSTLLRWLGPKFKRD